MTLSMYEQLIKEIGEYGSVLSETNLAKVKSLCTRTFPFYFSGHIDWNMIENKTDQEFSHLESYFIDIVKDIDQTVFLVLEDWRDAIELSFSNMINILKDGILDNWNWLLYSQSLGIIGEYKTGNAMKIGLSNCVEQIIDVVEPTVVKDKLKNLVQIYEFEQYQIVINTGRSYFENMTTYYANAIGEIETSIVKDIISSKDKGESFQTKEQPYHERKLLINCCRPISKFGNQIVYRVIETPDNLIRVTKYQPI